MYLGIRKVGISTNKGNMYDVIVIGGGAAGLMAAGIAARNGKKALLIEKMEKCGRKIRITGKGRCNLTNIKPRRDFLAKIKANADFFSYAYDSFDNQALIDFFRSEGVKLTIERGGRVFPTSEKAHDIANAMIDFAAEAGAEIMINTTVTAIRTLGDKIYGVKVRTKNGFERNIEAANVIICTGGITYPATGSTGDGYGFAHDLGHDIEELRPSLVPLLSDSEFAAAIQGTMLKNTGVKLIVDGETVADEFGELSFSSRGIEGPVTLRLSRMAVDALIEGRDVRLSLDLKTALDAPTLSARIDRELAEMQPAQPLSDLLRKLMPKPLIAPFIVMLGTVSTLPVRDMDEGLKAHVIALLKNIEVPITDYGTFEEAVVTAGGISVGGVDPRTMQSKLVKGLYFAGEVLDIDADTGGYNLQVAFSTGWLAGQLKK